MEETMSTAYHRGLYVAALVMAIGCATLAQTPTVLAQSGSAPYTFVGGFPTPETVTRAYEDADLNRAVQAYRFFYPNVSVYGLLSGFEPLGAQYNQAHIGFQGLI
jgi:hypothetical protein